MTDLRQRFEITDKGNLDEYLGVKVTWTDGGTIELTQPHFSDSIISDLAFKENAKGKNTPAPSTASINQDVNGNDYDKSWDYRSVIGKLNFLEKSTQTRHRLRSASVRKVFQQPEAESLCSGPTHRLLPHDNNGQGHNLEAKSMLCGCRLPRRMGR
jgi:hypothetical protein